MYEREYEEVPLQVGHQPKITTDQVAITNNYMHVHNETPVLLEANCMTVLDVSTPDTSGTSDVFDTPDTTLNMLACLHKLD